MEGPKGSLRMGEFRGHGTRGHRSRTGLLCALTHWTGTLQSRPGLVVAAVAGILTIPAGGNLPFAVSEPAVASEDISHSPRSPDMVTMTAYMREQAALAARLFQRTPHPGDDDVEPDYGL